MAGSLFHGAVYIDLSVAREDSPMSAPERITKPFDNPALSPVLVVDDSKAQRRLLTRTLEKWGYQTVEAASGQEALDLCAATAFDIIISDWMMPGVSGVDFCRSFRKASDRPALFLLLTAQTEREILAEGLESGADDFLSKPFHAVELRARLRAGRRSVQAQKALADKNLALSNTVEKLSVAYAAIERDLKGACVFQEGLLPDRFVSCGSSDVSLLFRSSGHVGGDLVGYFPVAPDELGIFSVDVSGHGVASALMTARIAGYFNPSAPDRNIALRDVGDRFVMEPLEDVCAHLNTVLTQDADSDQYLTMAIAHVDLKSRKVQLCHAGHPSSVVQRRSGAIEFLELWSTPVGLIDDGDFSVRSIELQEGDRLILYSDGITECPDPQGVLLDEEGFERILLECQNLTGAEFVACLETGLMNYRGGDDFPDDLSAVILEFH